MSANVMPSSLLRPHSREQMMPPPDMILAAWKKEREEQRQPQRHNSQHSVGTRPLSNAQSREQAPFNSLSVLTTDEDDDMYSPANETPIVRTTAATAVAESAHLSSFDADENETIITSHHASDFTEAMGRMPPLVTPRSSTAVAVGEEGGSLNRPMNPHSSNVSMQSSSCGYTAINHNTLQQRDETIQRLTFILNQWKKQHESLSQMQQQHEQLIENIRRCTEELDDNTNQRDQLEYEINARKEELSLLQEDINFAKTEKEQLEIEHKEKTLSLEQTSSRLRELRADLDKVNGERDEATQSLQDTKVNCDKLTSEAQSRLEECHVREEELKKQVAQSELLANELSSATEQLKQAREVLEKERAEMSKREDQIGPDTRHLGSDEVQEEGEQLQLVVDSFIFGRSVIFEAQNLLVASLSSLFT